MSIIPPDTFYLSFLNRSWNKITFIAALVISWNFIYWSIKSFFLNKMAECDCTLHKTSLLWSHPDNALVVHTYFAHLYFSRTAETLHFLWLPVPTVSICWQHKHEEQKNSSWTKPLSSYTTINQHLDPVSRYFCAQCHIDFTDLNCCSKTHHNSRNVDLRGWSRLRALQYLLWWHYTTLHAFHLLSWQYYKYRKKPAYFNYTKSVTVFVIYSSFERSFSLGKLQDVFCNGPGNSPGWAMSISSY